MCFLCFCRSFFFSLTQIDDRKDDRKCKQQYAYDLRRGKTEKEAADLIASQEFQNESDDGIYKEINYQEPLPELLFPVKDEKNYEYYQVAAGFDELDREAVNVINARIYGVAVNGKSESAFDSVAASSEKASDPAEEVEQRNADRKHVVHDILMSELRKSAGNVQSRNSSEKPSVEDHSAKIYSEQLRAETQERIVRPVLEQVYDVRNMGYSEDNVPANYHTHGNDHCCDYDVIDADALLFPYQQIADCRADKKSHGCTDRICAYSMSENIYRWIHVTNQKQLLLKGTTAFFPF